MSNKNRQQSFNKFKEVKDTQTSSIIPIVDQVFENKAVAPQTETPVQEVKQGVICDCTNLNIRKEASIEAFVLCTAPCDSVLEVIAECNLNPLWSKVKTKDDIIGFCMTEYIKLL